MIGTVDGSDCGQTFFVLRKFGALRSQLAGNAAVIFRNFFIVGSGRFARTNDLLHFVGDARPREQLWVVRDGYAEMREQVFRVL